MKSVCAKLGVTVIAIVLGGFLGGCAQDPEMGYSLGNVHRENVRSVAVPVFTRGKMVYRRELEMRLTEAIIKRVMMDTPYRIVPKSQADTVLTGTLENVSQRVMSYTPDVETARELEMVVTLSFRWQDLRTGEILAEERNLRTAGTYVLPQPYDEDFFTGSEEALNNAAKRVVEHMERDW